MARTRKINGKTYFRVFGANKKTNAQVIARRERRRGKSARIITTAGKLVMERQIPPNHGGYEETFNLEYQLPPAIYVVALIEDGQRKGHGYVSIIGYQQTPEYLIRGNSKKSLFISAKYKAPLMSSNISPYYIAE